MKKMCININKHKMKFCKKCDDILQKILLTKNVSVTFRYFYIRFIDNNPLPYFHVFSLNSLNFR